MNVIRRLIRTACLVSIFLFLVGQAAFTCAETLYVDFGNNVDQYRGIAVPNPDSMGHYWNSIQPGLLVPNMVDATNAPTTIDLGWRTGVGTDSYNGPAGDTSVGTPQDNLPFIDINAAALGDLSTPEAVFDFAAGPNVEDMTTHFKARFTLEQLVTTEKYNLTLYGAHRYSFDTTTVYNVYSDTNYTQLIGSTTLNVQNPSDPSKHNRDTLAFITNLTPGGQNNDTLYVEFVGSTGFLGYLNAMKVVGTGAPVLAGDYNGNNKVDAADYTIWRDTFGSITDLRANGDNTGLSMNKIDAADFGVWKANFVGGGAGGLSTSPAPEPSSIALSLLAGVGLAVFARRR